MYYYTFNIGDYVTSTHHLDEMEDLAYRRMIDLYYSKESPLPKNKADIAKRIRMQTHSECIANVLQEFFTLGPDGYHHERIDKDLEAYKTKSSKAKRAANARWNKNNDLEDANASTKQSECNADGMPTNNHKPITNNQEPKEEILVAPAKAEAIPYQHILHVYKEVLVSRGMTDCVKLTDARKAKIRTFWKKAEMNTHKWISYCEYIRDNCTWMHQDRDNGKGGKWGKKDLFYIAKEETYLRVKEDAANDR